MGFGHIIMNAFASMAPYGDSAFPPDPAEIEAWEAARPPTPEAKPKRRLAPMPSIMSFDDALLRSDSTRERFPEKAIRKLRSSSSLRSLRNRFRKGGRLRLSEVEEGPEGLADLDEGVERTDWTVRAVVPEEGSAKTESTDIDRDVLSRASGASAAPGSTTSGSTF